jgi:hypothetical protein
MIDDAAFAQIQGTVEDRAFMESLPVSRITESNYESVSPLSFHLYAHVRVFHCSQVPDFSLFGEKVGRRLRVVKQWGTTDGSVSVVLTADEAPPKWTLQDALIDVCHEAFILMFFPESSFCYIGSTMRTEKLYLAIMDVVCADGCRPLSYEETSRARAGLQSMKFFNVGLKNTTFNSQSETYRTLTGPQAERAVTSGDSRAYAQGHFFGSGMNGQIKETVGASSSSRIWSNQRLSIPDFVNWIRTLNTRIAGDVPFSATHLDIVRTSTALRRLPDIVIAANWPKQGFKANPKTRYRPSAQVAYKYSKLIEWDLQDFRSDPQAGRMGFAVAHVDGVVDMCFNLAQGRVITCLDQAATLEIESAHDAWMPLADWLCEHCPVFYAADKSSFEGMNLMAAPLQQTLRLVPGDTEAIAWDNCDITV